MAVSRCIPGASVLMVACAVAVATSAQAPPPPAPLAAYQQIPLWAGDVPLAKGTGPLDRPFLTVFLPPAGRANGASVVIAPGGANIMLMYGGEGLDIAERYNEWGVTAFVLTYRLSPRYDEAARVLDGKRAIQVMRANAARWSLNPDRIGYIGFSAGSSLGRAVVAAAGPGKADSSDPDRSRQLASRLPGARLRRRPRDRGREPQGVPADVSRSPPPATRDRRSATRSCSWT